MKKRDAFFSSLKYDVIWGRERERERQSLVIGNVQCKIKSKDMSNFV